MVAQGLGGGGVLIAVLVVGAIAIGRRGGADHLPPPGTPRPPPPPPPPPPPRGGTVPPEFVEALVTYALADVDRVVETSPNRGPEIDRMLEYTGQAPGQNWCAAALSSWIRDASVESGIAAPARSAGARALVDQLRAAGVVDWIPKASMPVGFIAPRGAIGLWDRSTRPGGWEAHVGVSEGRHADGPTWRSIEGNGPPSGDRVTWTLRTSDDPRLLGVAVWRTGVVA